MQDLLTDMLPNSEATEQSFITEFDSDANSYDCAEGPLCGKKWPERHSTQPMESITAEQLHPDLFPIAGDEVDDEAHDITAEPAYPYNDRYSQMAERCDFTKAHDRVEAARRYVNFPGIIVDEVDEDRDSPFHIGWGKLAASTRRYPARRNH